eukprot:SAG22_NODE_1817_length_3516_cov_34.397425_2_plen_208_part_00
MLFAEDRSDSTTKVESRIWVLDEAAAGGDGQWVLRQGLLTDGAHGAEHFETVDGVHHIAVANFGDRLGKRYKAQSTIWRCSSSATGTGAGGTGGQYELVQEVETQGATDCEHFVLDGQDYLAMGEATVMLLKAVITAFPCVSLPFLAVPLLSHRTVAISERGGPRQPAAPDQCDLSARAVAGSQRSSEHGRAGGESRVVKVESEDLV